MLSRLTVSLLLIISHASFSQEGFCLSGGFRNGYSCDVPLIAELDTRKAIFSIQLLESGGDRALSQLEHVVHVSEVEENKRLVYLGEYETQALGMAALQQAVKDHGSTHYPMLVALTPSEQMPRIRLVAEPNIEPSVTTGASAGDDTVISDRVYAIQLGAFSSAKDARQFSVQLSVPGLLCRQKNNGLYAVYYRKFKSLELASARLDDYPFIRTLDGYVVALNNVSFDSCSDLDAGPVMMAKAENDSAGDIATESQSNGDTAELPSRDTSMLIDSAELASTQADLDSEDSRTNHYDLVYSLQVAAFKQTGPLNRFVRKNGELPLLCRIRDNGLQAVYYGAYESWQEAKTHLDDDPLLTKMGAYAVKLKNVELRDCR